MSTHCNKSSQKFTSKNNMNNKIILTEILQRPVFKKIYKIISPILEKNPSHDLLHSLRVAKNALKIATSEGGDPETLVAAALLHDIVSLEKDDPKAHKSSELSKQKSQEILEQINFCKEKRKAVLDAILCHSFSAGLTPSTHDGKIFQDADRLDALGAIGIARVFVTGSRFDAKFYSHDDLFAKNRPLDDKKFTVDHFFVKLFKIPEKMLTKTGKSLAQERITFMKKFLLELEKEI